MDRALDATSLRPAGEGIRRQPRVGLEVSTRDRGGEALERGAGLRMGRQVFTYPRVLHDEGDGVRSLGRDANVEEAGVPELLEVRLPLGRQARRDGVQAPLQKSGDG